MLALEQYFKSEDIRLLSSIGFMAGRTGLLNQAVDIFEALILHRPKKNFGYIGLALANISVGETTEAVSILRERGLDSLPDDPELMSWLAISLHLNGQKINARRMISKIKLSGSETPILAILKKI